MDWEAFIALLRLHIGKTIGGVIAIATVSMAIGAWLLLAEQAHQHDYDQDPKIEGLVEFQIQQTERQKALLEKQEIRLEEKALRNEYIRKQCLAGQLLDKKDCARVGVRIN